MSLRFAPRCELRKPQTKKKEDENMDDFMRSKLEDELKCLSYRDGEGVVKQVKRKMDPNLRVLMVGFGGTGLDALERTVAELKMALPEDVYSKQVRILAVDTTDDSLKTSGDAQQDSNALRRKPDRFDRAKDWYMLPYTDAAAWKKNQSLIPVDMKEWVNPGVFDIVDFDGKGAGRIRQAGRILLTQPSAAVTLKGKIAGKITELYATGGTNNKLVVFLFFGLAGGTGSGCVIDGTYLIRNTIEDKGIDASFCGYLFMPAVADQDNKTLLNRNAYAALKEVDYYMNLERRGDTFAQRYGNIQVVSKKNLFRVCVIQEGRSNGLITDEKVNRKKAFSATANTILDNITALPVHTGAGAAVHSVDEYLSNLPNDYLGMVAECDNDGGTNNAPRAANYSFAILGHARALVPINLLKAYVMFRVFDEATRQFDKHQNATDEQAKEFLKECGVIGLFKDPYGKAKEKVDKYLKDCFVSRNQGPSYVVNLLRNACKFLDSKGNLNKDQTRIKEYLAKQNNNVFTVYTAVIQEISKYLKEGHGILTDVEFRNHVDHVSFSWILGEFDLKHTQNLKFAQDYLKDLVDDKQVRSLVGKFLNEMSENVEKWTELMAADPDQNPRFCAVKELRRFITNHIDAIVDSSVEDYLIKLYSGDTNVKAFGPNGQLTHEGERALKIAATNIISEMFLNQSKARPLAQYRSMGLIDPDRFPCKAFMYVPHTAPHLLAEIRSQIQNTPAIALKVKLYQGTSSDSITGYWRYDCVPAHQLEWTTEGERDYEMALSNGATSVGLHLSETSGGRQWKNLPNLCIRDVWPYLEDGYIQKREDKLTDQALETVNDAVRYGLTEERLDVAHNCKVCDLYLLEQANIPDPRLIQELDQQMPGMSAYDNAVSVLDAKVDEKAEALFRKLELGADDKLTTPISGDCTTDMDRQELRKALAAKGLVVEQIEVGGTLDVRTYSPVNAAPDSWVTDLAAKLLRTRVDAMFRLRGNILVMTRLAEKVEAHNEAVRRRNAAAAAVNDFAKLCSIELLEYRAYEGLNADGEEDFLCRWLYTDAQGNERILCDLNPTDKLSMTAKHFCAFQAYMELDQETRDFLVGTKNNMLSTNKKRMEAQAKFTELMKVLERLRTSKAARIVIDADEAGNPNVSRFLEGDLYSMASEQFVAANGKDVAAEIRNFYEKLTKITPVFP